MKDPENGPSSEDLLRAAREGLSDSSLPPLKNGDAAELDGANEEGLTRDDAPTIATPSESSDPSDPQAKKTAAIRPQPPIEFTPTSAASPYPPPPRPAKYEQTPWWRKRRIFLVAAVLVFVLLPLAVRQYNESQLDKLPEPDPLTEEESQQVDEFLESDVVVPEALADQAMQEARVTLGAPPLTRAELDELKALVATLDEAPWADCGDFDDWADDRFTNAIGVVDAEAAATFGAAVVVYSKGPARQMAAECSA